MKKMETNFNIESILVKAKTINGRNIFGYAFSEINNSSIKTYVKECIFKDNTHYCVDSAKNCEEVVTNSVCRSAGFLDRNKQLCFEYDLVEVKGDRSGYYYIYFESLWRKWGLKSNGPGGGMLYDLWGNAIVIGNIILNQNDYFKMQKQYEEKNKKQYYNDNSTCLSTQYKNKKARQFLPKR